MIMPTEFSLRPKENPWYDWDCQYHGRMGELYCEFSKNYADSSLLCCISFILPEIFTVIESIRNESIKAHKSCYPLKEY